MRYECDNKDMLLMPSRAAPRLRPGEELEAVIGNVMDQPPEIIARQETV